MSKTYKSSHYARIERVEQNHFWFQSRNILLKKLILRYIKDSRGKTFLEVGCGTGIVLRLLESLGFRVFGLDINKKALEYAKRGTKATLIQKSFLTYNTKKLFDVVGAFDVLEHIRSDEKFLRKSHDVLKPGGHVFLTVPAGMWLWSIVDEASGHIRRYSKNEIIRKVENAGFEVQYVNHWNMLPLPFYFGWKHVASKRKDIIEQYVKVPHKVTNIVFKTMLRIETWAFFRTKLPVGATLVVVGRKRD